MYKTLDDVMSALETYRNVTGGYPETLSMTRAEFDAVNADMRDRSMWTPSWPGIVTPGGNCTFFIQAK
jgi:hypothetical protein